MAWAARAGAARRALDEAHWDQRRGLFRVGTGPADRARWATGRGPWHPWWQAHGLQVLLDGVAARDGASAASARRAGRLVDGIERRQGGLLANDFHDDLAWLGLALLRAHRLGIVGPERPVRLAAHLAAALDRDGGLAWRAGDPLRNVASTAAAALLLLRAAPVAQEPAWRELAAHAATWLHRTLVDPTGVVWDGARPHGGRLVPEGRLWSYNVGLVAALDVALAGQRPGPEQGPLLLRAAGVLRAGIEALEAGCGEVPAAAALLRSRSTGGAVSPGGFFGRSPWRDEACDGRGPDPQLFRGILAVAVADLVLACRARGEQAGTAGDRPGGGGLLRLEAPAMQQGAQAADRSGPVPGVATPSPALLDALVADLARQGTAAWAARDARGRIGPGWVTPVPDPPSLAAHLAGCLVLGSLERLERHGADAAGSDLPGAAGSALPGGGP